MEKHNKYKLGWLHDIRFFVIFVVAFVLMFKFLIGISFVVGDSMEPTLHDKQCVIYNRLAENFSQGDLISIWVPSGDYYVKRVIAVGGDVVDIRDGVVYVNDVALEEDYTEGYTDEEETLIYPYTVGEGNVFVLGDNRETSMDSRTFGEVGDAQIRGKIFFRFGE